MSKRLAVHTCYFQIEACACTYHAPQVAAGSREQATYDGTHYNMFEVHSVLPGQLQCSAAMDNGSAGI